MDPQLNMAKRGDKDKDKGNEKDREKVAAPVPAPAPTKAPAPKPKPPKPSAKPPAIVTTTTTITTLSTPLQPTESTLATTTSTATGGGLQGGGGTNQVSKSPSNQSTGAIVGGVVGSLVVVVAAIALFVVRRRRRGQYSYSQKRPLTSTSSRYNSRSGSGSGTGSGSGFSSTNFTGNDGSHLHGRQPSWWVQKSPLEYYRQVPPVEELERQRKERQQQQQQQQQQLLHKEKLLPQTEEPQSPQRMLQQELQQQQPSLRNDIAITIHGRGVNPPGEIGTALANGSNTQSSPHQPSGHDNSNHIVMTVLDRNISNKNFMQRFEPTPYSGPLSATIDSPTGFVPPPPSTSSQAPVPPTVSLKPSRTGSTAVVNIAPPPQIPIQSPPSMYQQEAHRQPRIHPVNKHSGSALSSLPRSPPTQATSAQGLIILPSSQNSHQQTGPQGSSTTLASSSTSPSSSPSDPSTANADIDMDAPATSGKLASPGFYDLLDEAYSGTPIDPITPLPPSVASTQNNHAAVEAAGTESNVEIRVVEAGTRQRELNEAHIHHGSQPPSPPPPLQSPPPVPRATRPLSTNRGGGGAGKLPMIDTTMVGSSGRATSRERLPTSPPLLSPTVPVATRPTTTSNVTLSTTPGGGVTGSTVTVEAVVVSPPQSPIGSDYSGSFSPVDAEGKMALSPRLGGRHARAVRSRRTTGDA